MQNFDHNIGFWEKRQFFRQKLPKNAENCDHNIDPCLHKQWKFCRMDVARHKLEAILYIVACRWRHEATQSDR
jgi:hypothetical protein